MKNYFILTLASLALLAGGCKKDNPNDVYVPPSKHITHKEPDYQPVPKKDLEPEPSNTSQIIPDDREGKSIERQNYEDAVKVAEKNRTSYIPETKDLTGREITYYHIILNQINDSSVLEQMRYAIYDTAQANNYKITDEQAPDRKSLKFKIWSELGPINCEDTIRNALFDYKVTVVRKDDNLIMVTD